MSRHSGRCRGFFGGFLNSLNNTRTVSTLVVPVDTGVTFFEASRSASVTYKDFLGYWDKQISLRVNGKTPAKDVGAAGSRAASGAHADLLGLVVDDGSDLQSATRRNTLIRQLADYNLPDARLPSI